MDFLEEAGEATLQVKSQMWADGDLFAVCWAGLVGDADTKTTTSVIILL